MKLQSMKIDLEEVLRVKNARRVEIEIKEELTCLEIRPQGYGDLASADGNGCPIILEIADGKLRLVVWADINKDEPTHFIDLEGARETARKKEKRIIESNNLPYFGDDGIVNIFDRMTGKRVFAKKENFKDITTDGGRMNGSFKFEITEE